MKRAWILGLIFVPLAFVLGAWLVFTLRFLTGILPHGGAW
jgi:hypothetical protein